MTVDECVRVDALAPIILDASSACLYLLHHVNALMIMQLAYLLFECLLAFEINVFKIVES